ncbi:MAG TPA: hypothetical protein VGF74_00005 [Thermoleophilaceae bacterium]
MLIEDIPPDRWTVELRDQAPVYVWAWGYAHQGDHYSLWNLVQLETGEQAPDGAVVSVSTPGYPSQIQLSVARFRVDQVRLEEGDEDWPAIYNGEPPDDAPDLTIRVLSGPPSRWTVELATGIMVDVWAERFTRVDGQYIFTNRVELLGEATWSPDMVVIGDASTRDSPKELAVAAFREDQVRACSEKRPPAVETP